MLWPWQKCPNCESLDVENQRLVVENLSLQIQINATKPVVSNETPLPINSRRRWTDVEKVIVAKGKKSSNAQ